MVLGGGLHRAKILSAYKSQTMPAATRNMGEIFSRPMNP